MISRTVEYALRAIVWLASRPESPHTTREVAEATLVPANYLAKVLQTLVEGGIISSQRGLGGGFVLTRDPASLSVLDVVNAVEPLQRIRACPLKISSHAVRLCALHQSLDDALATVERAFASASIADLVKDRAERPLCPVPAEPVRRPAVGNLAAGPPPATATTRGAKSATKRGRQPRG